MTRNRGGRGHHWTDQMGAAVAPLAAFKVAIRRAGAAFVRRQNVSVHADTHTAACIAPFESGIGENFVEAFLLGRGLDAARARNNQRLLDAFGNAFPRDQMGGSTEVVEA